MVSKSDRVSAIFKGKIENTIKIYKTNFCPNWDKGSNENDRVILQMISLLSKFRDYLDRKDHKVYRELKDHRYVSQICEQLSLPKQALFSMHFLLPIF